MALIERVDLRRFRLLVVATLLVVWTLAPFEFDPRGLAGRFAAASAWRLGDGIVEALAHLAAFFCFGFLLREATLRPAAPLLVAFCLALETAQLFIPDRH